MSVTTASSITKAASQQTYFTIRFLVDRERVEDAYRAYAYFRWVDDTLDAVASPRLERLAFIERQKSLLECCYRGLALEDVNLQEQMLVDLIRGDQERNSGVQVYLRNMMQVMEFDARRRGRLISHKELNEYTRYLATAVMECIHNFIGHDDYAPQDECRYHAVSAAHITHMLRDTFDDLQTGYYNVPAEFLEEHHLGPQDVGSEAYRSWVKSRVALARDYFRTGKEYFESVQNIRCRLACFAYIARFEWLLDTIEREEYLLRPQYPERNAAKTGLRMGWQTILSMLDIRAVQVQSQSIASQRQGRG